MFVRGSTINFAVTFKDENGDSSTPDSATLNLKFRLAAGGVDRATIDLAKNGENVWEGSWDSSVARPGLVAWSVTGAGQEKIAQDGELTLVANDANQAA